MDLAHPSRSYPPQRMGVDEDRPYLGVRAAYPGGLVGDECDVLPDGGLAALVLIDGHHHRVADVNPAAAAAAAVQVGCWHRGHVAASCHGGLL